MFEQLKCGPEGLSTQEGENRLQIFGPNKLEEKKVKENYEIVLCILTNFKKKKNFLIILNGIQ